VRSRYLALVGDPGRQGDLPGGERIEPAPYTIRGEGAIEHPASLCSMLKALSEVEGLYAH